MQTAPSSAGRPLKRPQFRLRSLMLAVTGCCVLFALMREVGPLASTGLCFFILLVVLHVAGNALGTSLRDESSGERIDAEPALRAEKPLAPPSAGAPSRLRERSSLGRTVIVLTACGATLGGSLSSLAYAYWTDIHAAGIIVGSISAAIVGGFLGFVASSFLQMIFRAWRQALDQG